MWARFDYDDDDHQYQGFMIFDNNQTHSIPRQATNRRAQVKRAKT